MTVNRIKKSARSRGQKTHFGGAKKKRRGAGNRGGRGMAGSGKRADQKKPTIFKLYGSSYFGKHGFHRPQKVLVEEKTINIGYIEDHVMQLGKKENDSYIVNVKELGYTKVLGSGRVTRKYKIIAGQFSKKAKEKIEHAGGEAQCLS